MGTGHWPLWDLRIRTPRLELRPVREQEMAALVDLALEGIHDPEDMPFLQPLTDAPSPELERTSYQYYLRNWAEWSVESWALQFAVYEGDDCVGTQALMGRRFPVRRVVTTGSWVGRAHQGRGIGKEMRAAVLHLAFEWLGAHRAETEAFEDNDASLGVTAALGYRPNGDGIEARRDVAARVLRFAMDRDDWECTRRDDIRVHGVGTEVLDQFGLA